MLYDHVVQYLHWKKIGQTLLQCLSPSPLDLLHGMNFTALMVFREDWSTPLGGSTDEYLRKVSQLANGTCSVVTSFLKPHSPSLGVTTENDTFRAHQEHEQTSVIKSCEKFHRVKCICLWLVLWSRSISEDQCLHCL